MSSSKVKQLERAVKLAQEGLRSTKAELNGALSRTLARCTGRGRPCGRSTQIRKLIYIQTFFYIRPHGCTEGDYWKRGEGQFDCPHCGHRNRLYDRPGLVKLKHLFKDTVKAYNARQ